MDYGIFERLLKVLNFSSYFCYSILSCYITSFLLFFWVGLHHTALRGLSLSNASCTLPVTFLPLSPWFCHNIKVPLTKLSLSLILYLWCSTVACRFALNPQDSCNEWSCNLYQLHCCCCFAFILVLDLLLWGLWRRYPLVWNAP